LFQATRPFTTKKVFLLLDKVIDYFELTNQVLFKDNIQFDYEKGFLVIEGDKIILTTKETLFLKLLMENSIVSYIMMYEYLWDYEKSPSQDAVKSFIRKLKRKIDIELFQNQKGEGYYLI
jgi:DNA-binding response OmpR family regulator